MAEDEIENNMFDDVEDEFSEENEPEELKNTDEEELTLDSVRRTNFIKLPKVGEKETYVIEKITNNPRTHGKTKDGTEFRVGVKTKDGEYIRRDVHTDKGTFTINSWGLFYKFFGTDSELLKLAEKREKETGKKGFGGFKVTIQTNLHGNYARKPTDEVEKLLGVSTEEAEEYKKKVAKAINDNTLYTVTFEE